MAIYQLSVFMENHAGQLAGVTDILAENGIDMRALNIAEIENYGVLRVILDDYEKGAALLTERGHVVKVTKVISLAVPDEPGGLNEALRVLARENINIEYMYSVFGRRQGKAYMIFKVADPDAAEEALKAAGFIPGGAEDLEIR